MHACVSNAMQSRYQKPSCLPAPQDLDIYKTNMESFECSLICIDELASTLSVKYHLLSVEIH